jgi:hypothetical protein
VTWDPTPGAAATPLPEGEAGFGHLQRVALALELQIRNAGVEYKKGTDQVQLYLDRGARLLWLLRRDLSKLPVHPQGHQPSRLDGGDAA